jgi:hypothetical protein
MYIYYIYTHIGFRVYYTYGSYTQCNPTYVNQQTKRRRAADKKKEWHQHVNSQCRQCRSWAFWLLAISLSRLAITTTCRLYTANFFRDSKTEMRKAKSNILHHFATSTQLQLPSSLANNRPLAHQPAKCTAARLAFQEKTTPLTA